MYKIIKPGQLISYNNVIYRCCEMESVHPFDTCHECALTEKCVGLPFGCESNSYFKRVRRERHQKPEQVSTKNLPKTRRCKRLQNNSL